MHKRFPTIWRFLLPLLVLFIAAPVVLVRQQTLQQLERIEVGATEQAKTLVRLLNVTDELVGAQAVSAMLLLKERSLALGVPTISGTIELEDKTVPNLVLGITSQANNFELVDGVANMVGGTATLFVKSGNDFVRIATNIQHANHTRVVGTNLNANGKAIAALRSGRAFHGVVDILVNPTLVIMSRCLMHKGLWSVLITLAIKLI